MANLSLMAQIIREGMDAYWRAIYAPSDEGLSDIEIRWRRQHEADMKRMEEKYGHIWDKYFNKGAKDG